jgi:protein-tyrosine phosphatase
MNIPAPILASTPNFRDLGGYTGLDGRTVRTNRIYRSQLIATLTSADRETLRGIAIRSICDLRGVREHMKAPNAWIEPPEPAMRNLDIGMDVRAGAGELLTILAADPTENGVRTMMMKTYSLLPHAFEGKLAPVLDDLVSGDRYPFLIHCTAGKDRTGFLCALILLSLGVPLETVHHDYALTNHYTDLTPMMAASAEYLTTIVSDKIVPTDGMLRLLCGTSPDYLNAALAAVNDRYGSVETYLERTAGFDSAKRARLRELMLD